MAEHRFRPGDRVQLQQVLSVNSAEAFLSGDVPDVLHLRGSAWEVVRAMPADALGPQYQIQEESGAYRVAHERELQPA